VNETIYVSMDLIIPDKRDTRYVYFIGQSAALLTDTLGCFGDTMENWACISECQDIYFEPKHL